MLTVLGIYLFIVVGFFAKKIFKEIDGKTLVILSTYFLQPFLTLWGIMLIPINYDLIISPLVYLLSVFVAFAFTSVVALFLRDKKERIIASLTPLIGNTGNLGIPLSYALFGDIGASIATMINLANIFLYILSGFFSLQKGNILLKRRLKKL